MITVTEIEHYHYNTKTKIGKWVKSLQFWYADFSNLDFKTDWRFCEVKNKRTQAIFLGLIDDDIKFPIQFPIVLNNGKIILEFRMEVYDDEKE